jgi:hypothetical protein
VMLRSVESSGTSTGLVKVCLVSSISDGM